jgi:hypothetical protein
MPKNDLFLNCGTKTKQLSKKELSNGTPASTLDGQKRDGPLWAVHIKKKKKKKQCSKFSPPEATLPNETE